MDPRNVRILRPYDDGSCEDNAIYVDDSARYALHIQWGEKCKVVGRRPAEAVVKELKPCDADGFICRMNESLRDALYVEVGDEVLLYDLE
ncbi:MAG: hypothetical protein Q4B73_02410 [Lachnospiraceae bacterium]|nr:hypothetical protein [Lachnospiraceae bacterium]